MQVKSNYFETLRGVKKITRTDGKSYTVRDNRSRFFFPDEWMTFYDKLLPKQKITFMFLINTGARIMEAQHVKVKDVDLDRGNIILRITKRVKKGKDMQEKPKPRIISISTQFCKYLRRYIKENNLEPENHFNLLETTAANRAMKKALQKAGIKDWEMFSSHNVRKTLETWLMALSIDSFKIIKHFGHTLAVAAEHYVAPDVFDWDDKDKIRKVIGDLYLK